MKTIGMVWVAFFAARAETGPPAVTSNSRLAADEFCREAW